MKLTIEQLKQLIKEQIEDSGVGHRYIGDGADAYGNFEVYYNMPLALFAKITNLTPEDIAVNPKLKNKIRIENKKVSIYT